MANPHFTSQNRFPITLKPITKPDDKETHTDIFNILKAFRLLLYDLEGFFLGEAPRVVPPNDDQWITVGPGVPWQDMTEQSTHASGTGAGTHLVLRLRPLPVLNELTVLVGSQNPPVDFAGAGLVLRNSTTGALKTIGMRGTKMTVASYTGPTDPAPVIDVELPFIPSVTQWYKVENTGGNMSFQTSADGSSWIQYHVEPSGTYDQAGFYLSTEQVTTPPVMVAARLFHWFLK